MTGRRGIRDKTVAAVSLIEEGCLGVLLEDLAQRGDTDGMSTEEIAERIGLNSWLGRQVGTLVVEKVLLNLSRAGKVEPVPTTLVGARWTIAESEATIRPTPTSRAPT